MNSLNNDLLISYPKKLINDLNRFPANHSVPCSVLSDYKEICGILIPCRSKDIDYFDINPDSPSEPPVKFRMVDYNKRFYAVEIWLHFNQEYEKILKMQLNPHDKHVQKLLQLGSETKMISFHFYDTQSHTLSSAVTNIDEEEVEWFKRNFNLASRLSSSQRGYKKIAKQLRKKASDTDRFFKFYNRTHPDYFVKEGGMLVVFQD